MNLNFIEIFLIILNISIFNTIAPSILFGNWHPQIHQLFILIINIFYLLSNDKIYLFSINRRNKFICLIAFMLIFMFFFEIPRYYIGGLKGYHLVITLQSGLAMFSFGLVLNKIYNKYKMMKGEKNAIFSIIKAYVFFCLIIVVISDVVFILWQMNFVDIFKNPIPSNVSSFIDNKLQDNASYFSPFNITIIISESRVANLATFCGISYEPHIATHFMTPAMFCLHGLDGISKIKKTIYTILFMVFFLAASSATNFLVLLFLFFIMIMKLLLIDKKIMMTFFLITTMVVMLCLINLENIEKIYLFQKITSSGGSADYSRGFLEYVLSPTTLWGDGVFNVPYPYAHVDNIGYIFSILIISFYLLGFFSSIKAIFQSNKLLQFVGFAALYFFLHSLKVVQLIFIFPFTVFIIFLLLKAYEISIPRANLAKWGQYH